MTFFSRKQISILYNIHPKCVKSLETGVCRLTIYTTLAARREEAFQSISQLTTKTINYKFARQSVVSLIMQVAFHYFCSNTINASHVFSATKNTPSLPSDFSCVQAFCVVYAIQIVLRMQFTQQHRYFLQVCWADVTCIVL